MAVDDLLDELLQIAEESRSAGVDGTEGLTPIQSVATVQGLDALSDENKKLLDGTTQYDKLLMLLKDVLSEQSEVSSLNVFMTNNTEIILNNGSKIGYLPTSFDSLLDVADDEMKQQIAVLFTPQYTSSGVEYNTDVIGALNQAGTGDGAPKRFNAALNLLSIKRIADLIAEKMSDVVSQKRTDGEKPSHEECMGAYLASRVASASARLAKQITPCPEEGADDAAGDADDCSSGSKKCGLVPKTCNVSELICKFPVSLSGVVLKTAEDIIQKTGGSGLDEFLMLTLVSYVMDSTDPDILEKMTFVRPQPVDNALLCGDTSIAETNTVFFYDAQISQIECITEEGAEDCNNSYHAALVDCGGAISGRVTVWPSKRDEPEFDGCRAVYRHHLAHNGFENIHPQCEGAPEWNVETSLMLFMRNAPDLEDLLDYARSIARKGISPRCKSVNTAAKCHVFHLPFCAANDLHLGPTTETLTTMDDESLPGKDVTPNHDYPLCKEHLDQCIGSDLDDKKKLFFLEHLVLSREQLGQIDAPRTLEEFDDNGVAKKGAKCSSGNEKADETYDIYDSAAGSMWLKKDSDGKVTCDENQMGKLALVVRGKGYDTDPRDPNKLVPTATINGAKCYLNSTLYKPVPLPKECVAAGPNPIYWILKYFTYDLLEPMSDNTMPDDSKQKNPLSWVIPNGGGRGKRTAVKYIGEQYGGGGTPAKANNLEMIDLTHSFQIKMTICTPSSMVLQSERQYIVPKVDDFKFRAPCKLPAVSCEEEAFLAAILARPSGEMVAINNSEDEIRFHLGDSDVALTTLREDLRKLFPLGPKMWAKFHKSIKIVTKIQITATAYTNAQSVEYTESLGEHTQVYTVPEQDASASWEKVTPTHKGWIGGSTTNLGQFIDFFRNKLKSANPKLQTVTFQGTHPGGGGGDPC